MTRRAFAEASGIPVVTLKQIETHGVKPRAVTLAKIYALQKRIGADGQQEILDHKAERAAIVAAAKLAAAREKALDKLHDKMLALARKPRKKSARQLSIF